MLYGKRKEIAGEYIKKFPNASNTAIARILCRDVPEMFNNLDNARRCVRYVKGTAGKNQRKYMMTKKKTKSNFTGFKKIPEGLKEIEDWKIVKLRLKKTLCLADVHIPFHDFPALTAALRYGKEQGCTDVLLLGDFIDFFAISYFRKDPRKRDLPKEIETYYKVMDVIKETFGGRIIYKIGNHEERYNQFMELKAPELLGVDDFKLSKVLRFNQYGIEPIYNKQPLKINKTLTALHGHEFAKSVFSPVNPARGLFLRTAGQTAICGHYHSTSEHSQKNINGHIITCWSQGALCNLHPKWQPINKWNHGFSIIDTRSDDIFVVDNKKIIDGQIV